MGQSNFLFTTKEILLLLLLTLQTFVCFGLLHQFIQAVLSLTRYFQLFSLIALIH
jgi:hypothetical protein